MRREISFACAVLACLATAPALARAAAELTIDGGSIAAAAPLADGVRVYKGLPYAAPPVGPLRWREPAQVPRWKGLRAVDTYAPNCLQPKVFKDIDPFAPSMSEDCLYLNVSTAAKPGEALPVFFWIHGGGYMAGYGGERRHDGGALARKGVVVVTLNYRLGAFGFLAHPGLSAQSAHRASGNYALMDMIAALRWVRRNIAKFGGDPNLVTIAGESAGSDAVSRLMASPEAHGLFERAIGESGAAFGTMGPDPTLAEGEAMGVAFAQSLDSDDIEALRRRSSAEILAAELAPNTQWRFRPVIDGWILPASAADIFAAGKQNDVPLLVGWNVDEGRSFAGVVFAQQNLAQVLAANFGGDAARASTFYPSTTPADEAASRELLAGDVMMKLPTWRWAVAETRTGHSAVYLYEFAHHPPIPADWFGDASTARDMGAFHSGEIPYIFGHPDIFPSWKATDDDRELGNLMSSYWAAFARGGDPNGEGRPHWTAYLPDGSAKRMIFDAKSGEEEDTGLARRRFIDAAHLAAPGP